jgi:pyruvate,water dikinase
VSGIHTLLSACKRCWASLFTDPAIIYREVRGIDHLAVDQCVSIQPMDIDSTKQTAQSLVASAISP